jgi:hypothetical protein
VKAGVALGVVLEGGHSSSVSGQVKKSRWDVYLVSKRAVDCFQDWVVGSGEEVAVPRRLWSKKSLARIRTSRESPMMV